VQFESILKRRKSFYRYGSGHKENSIFSLRVNKLPPIMVMKISPKPPPMTTLTPITGAPPASRKLSDSAQRVLRFIKDYFKTTNSMPTIREIMRYVGFRSTNSVYKQIKKLEEAGELYKKPNGRIAFLPEGSKGLSFAGGARAGFSSPVDETKVEMFSLDEFLIQKPKQTFLLTVSGDSMIGAGILDGDYVLVERGSPYKTGDLIVASTDTGYVIKYFIKKGDQTILRSANPIHKDVPFQEGWSVFGPVTAVFRKTMKI